MRLLAPEDFEPWVGRAVRVNTLPKPVEVMLERIERQPKFARGHDHREPFSLFFASALDVYLLDTAYEFDCGRGGPYSFVIAQLVPSQTRRHYQAVFA